MTDKFFWNVDLTGGDGEKRGDAGEDVGAMMGAGSGTKII